MIVQELQAIQEAHGYLPESALRGLSEKLRVPLYRLHEVASFYPHYRLRAGAVLEVRVCRDLACHLRGAGRLSRRLQQLAGELGDDRVAVQGVSCLGQCDRAPAATIAEGVYCGLSDEQWERHVRGAAEGKPLALQGKERSGSGWRIDPYDGGRRWEAIRRFMARGDADLLLKELETAGLRGMGGAGFPTHRKWSLVRAAEGQEKYVVCNADESEPGTFKDRELLLRAPYLVIEGMVLAGLVTGATKGYVYVRQEYSEETEAVEEAIAEARQEGVCGRGVLGTARAFDVELFVSPGGYICGEETAMLEAMEDRRAEPRNKPPYPVTHGLYGKPTLINNVETLAWVPAIVLRGGAWYRDQGVNGAKGLRLVSVSGDVAKPGVYEVPFGLTVGELIDHYGGGMRDGQRLKAIAPSGPSSGFLPAEAKRESLPEGFVAARLDEGAAGFDMRDLTLDFSTLGQLGSMLGGAFVVIGERCCMVDVALNCTEFFRNESCGKCVPCRVGSQKLSEMLAAMARGEAGQQGRIELVHELAEAMSLTSICGLGMVAANPMTTLMRFFADELRAHRRGHCPAGVCVSN